MKIAGIKPFSRTDDNFIDELKQAALLFDKIGIPLLDPFLNLTPHPHMHIKSELRLLKDKNFLFDAWQQGPVKLAKGVDLKEIQSELEFKLYQYRKSLDTHQIKYKSGILQSFIVGSTELLENIARLKFSLIAKGIFSANQKKIDLLNIELNAPGHELAYIYQVQEAFK